MSLPRRVGDHPDGGHIEAAIGRYGPYVMWAMPIEEGKKTGRKIYANIQDPAEVFTIGMNRAVELIAQKAAKGGRGAAAEPLKELGEHPTEGGPVNVMDGRYGPYVKWAKINATLPKEMEPATVTMEQAVELITAKAGHQRQTQSAKEEKEGELKRAPGAFACFRYTLPRESAGDLRPARHFKDR